MLSGNPTVLIICIVSVYHQYYVKLLCRANEKNYVFYEIPYLYFGISGKQWDKHWRDFSVDSSSIKQLVFVRLLLIFDLFIWNFKIAYVLIRNNTLIV